MSLLTYTKHVSPTSHKDVLAKIRAFAIAQGWTSDDYQTSVQWAKLNGTYGWAAGTEDFLQLSSNGYGSQDMIFRFRLLATGVDPQAESFYLAGIEPGHGTPDDSLSTHPLNQDRYTSNRFYHMTLPPGSSTALWLFGNDKFIIAINQLTQTLAMALYFGTVELFDQTENEAFMACMSFYYQSVFSDWYEAEGVDVHAFFELPWVHRTPSSYPYWYYDGGATADVEYSVKNHVQGSYHGSFNRLDFAVAKNNFTGKRTLIKPTVFLKRDSDSMWFPVGTFPLYAIEYTGLTIGQKLTYGSEEYLCFPNILQSRRYGAAFRIA